MELSDLLQDDLLRFCESSEDSDYSFDLDQLLATALDEYESQSGSRPASETPDPTATTSPTPKSRFAAPKTATDIQEARRQGVPKKTQQDQATVSECGSNGGDTGKRPVETQFHL